MSDYQKLLRAIAADLIDLSSGQVAAKLLTIAKTLDGIREFYHKDAVFAALDIDQREENAA